MITSTCELTAIIVYHTCSSYPSTESLIYLYVLDVLTELQTDPLGTPLSACQK